MKRVAYLVSRFPHPTETFIVRELDRVDADPRLDISLLSLFPPKKRAVVQPAARRWTADVKRPGQAAAAFALLAWLARRPVRTLTSLAKVVHGCARSPGVLLRSLMTIPIAADHARRIQREQIEHVHAHYATYPALAAWFIARLTGVPFSLTVHAHDLFVDQSMLRDKVGEARFVIAVSEYNKRFLEAYGGGTITPVHVIHCGIDPDAYPFNPRDAPREGPVKALCVGSLEEYKGHRYLLEALCAPGLEHIQLSFVGDGPLRSDLEQLSQDLGLEDRVEWTGELDEAGVASALARSQIFVLPSVVAGNGQMEGLPVALVEALANGLTVVSTRVSGIPEVIEGGVTGLLAEPADAESLAEQIRRALVPAAVDHAAGRQLVERDFNVAITGGALAGLLSADTGAASDA